MFSIEIESNIHVWFGFALLRSVIHPVSLDTICRYLFRVPIGSLCCLRMLLWFSFYDVVICSNPRIYFGPAKTELAKLKRETARSLQLTHVRRLERFS